MRSEEPQVMTVEEVLEIATPGFEDAIDSDEAGSRTETCLCADRR